MRSWAVRRSEKKAARRRRAHCQRLLAAVDLPQPFDLTTFVDQAGRERGRPIRLHPWPGISGPGSPSGLWLATESCDHIYYEQNTSPLHQEQIVLHEYAHMLLDHEFTLDPGDAGQLLPDLGSELIRKALARTSYNSEQENEAETLASLILQKAYQQRAEPTWQIPEGQAEVVARLDRSLRHDPRA